MESADAIFSVYWDHEPASALFSLSSPEGGEGWGEEGRLSPRFMGRGVRRSEGVQKLRCAEHPVLNQLCSHPRTCINQLMVHRIFALLLFSASALLAAESKPVPPLRTRSEVEAVLSKPADRKSTRLNSSHEWISYAVFCLKKK